ncbi:MAG: glycine/betaine ABC transporter substrate-binding protein [Blautia sp.]|nr:glycine/betaine ABC transporter substrate-binding protein [Blautia sp.]
MGNVYRMRMSMVLVSVMTAASVICGSTAVLADGEALHIATKPMTEQYILGEMLKLIIEDKTDYTCEITKGIGGGTSNIMPAMESGDFDLYPEYTSSGYVLVLGHEAKGVEDDEMWDQLLEEYHDQYGMKWVSHYGFNNTYCITVSGEAAREYDLRTCSDMAAVSDKLIFGGNPDYIEREDGFPAVCDTYGCDFKEIKSIDIGLKYAALMNGDIDVTNGYTTDAQLGVQDVVALEDDKHLQVNYFCSTVVREDTLESHPGLEDALMLMEGILSDSEMASLNARVEVDGDDEASVAKDYLIEKGILEG